ncbi:MAG: hypothetical protein ACRDU5_14780 [Mycobacterium sp.]
MSDPNSPRDNQPKIFRASPDSGVPQPPPADSSRTRRLLDESSQRFGAGTTYGGSGRQQRPPAPPPAAHVTPPRPAPQPAPRPAPPPPRPPAPAPRVPQGAAAPAHVTPGDMLFDFKPHYALWILTGLWVVLALLFLPGISFWLTAVGCAAAAWYTRTNHIGWPADIQEFLVRRRLAAPTQHARAAEVGDAEPVVPLRAMSIPELFGGAVKVVLKNWPTLLGIPLVILVGFVLAFGAILFVMYQILFHASSAMSGGVFMATTTGGTATMIAMLLVFIAMSCVIALPADALLIVLTVIATDKAVRGEPVRFGEVLRLAKKRIFAVCRLTLTFYAIFCVPQFLLTGLTSLLAGATSPAFYLVTLATFVFFFVLGILWSMSPIVLVIEERGVVDSLKRSMQLCKPLWGRLLAIHLFWAVCAVPLLVIGLVIMFNPVLYAIAIAFLIAYFRTLQMLIYTDLRMRQENYDRELLADWTRNMGREGAL